MTIPGDETQLVADWVYDTLTGDAALSASVTGVAADLAPEDFGHGPFVVFQLLDGADVRGVGTAHVMVDALWVIKAVHHGQSYETLRPIVERINQLLVGTPNHATPEGNVWVAVRETPLRYPEVDPDGLQWRHLGGTYRVLAQSHVGA